MSGQKTFFRGFGIAWRFAFDTVKLWGYRGPNPFLPYEWLFYLGPVCFYRLTDRKPRKLSRQEKRHLERQLRKRARSLAKLAVVVLCLAAVTACSPFYAWRSPAPSAPVDQIYVQVAPGTGWEVRADKQDPLGRYYRDVTLIIRVLGPEKLAGADAEVWVNGSHVLFKPNAEHTWTVEWKAGLGKQEIKVRVGDRTWERALYVWREYR